MREASATFVRHQGHEAGPLNGLGNGMLARGLAAGLPAADDAAVAVGELAQQIEILVIHEHRTRTFAIDANGILLGDLLHAAGRLALKHNLGRSATRPG
jgi:hypothetical protein